MGWGLDKLADDADAGKNGSKGENPDTILEQRLSLTEI